MPFFQTKKISVETLGEYLHDTRMSLKLSLQQVARITQIPEKFILNLENSEYEHLPADVYVKGFLKSLSTVYRVSADSLIQQFDRERGLARSLKNDPLQPRGSVAIAMPRMVITPKTFTFASVAAIAVISLGYLIWQVRSVSAPPELAVAYPGSDVSIETRSILLRGSTEPGSRVYINDQEILVEENGGFSEILNLVEGSNTVAVRAENKFHKSTAVNRTIVVNSPDDTASTTLQLITDSISLTISIGPEDTWVSARADGESIQDGIIVSGDALTLRAEKELLLTTGNAGSTHLVFNGRDLGILGRVGEVLSNIRFTR